MDPAVEVAWTALAIMAAVQWQMGWANVWQCLLKYWFPLRNEIRPSNDEALARALAESYEEADSQELESEMKDTIRASEESEMKETSRRKRMDHRAVEEANRASERINELKKRVPALRKVEDGIKRDKQKRQVPNCCWSYLHMFYL
jgi:hypothetical protein